jgi:hypothetical protein
MDWTLRYTLISNGGLVTELLSTQETPPSKRVKMEMRIENCTKGVRRNEEPPLSSAISEIGNLWSSSDSKTTLTGSNISPSGKGGSSFLRTALVPCYFV